jgi:hypothetical protein
MTAKRKYNYRWEIRWTLFSAAALTGLYFCFSSPSNNSQSADWQPPNPVRDSVHFLPVKLDSLKILLDEYKLKELCVLNEWNVNSAGVKLTISNLNTNHQLNLANSFSNTQYSDTLKDFYFIIDADKQLRAQFPNDTHNGCVRVPAGFLYGLLRKYQNIKD